MAGKALPAVLAKPLSKFFGSTATDDEHIAGLAKKSGSATYMTSVSPWFFTHYGADSFNKNVGHCLVRLLTDKL